MDLASSPTGLYIQHLRFYPSWRVSYHYHQEARFLVRFSCLVSGVRLHLVSSVSYSCRSSMWIRLHSPLRIPVSWSCISCCGLFPKFGSGVCIFGWRNTGGERPPIIILLSASLVGCRALVNYNNLSILVFARIRLFIGLHLLILLL